MDSIIYDIGLVVCLACSKSFSIHYIMYLTKHHYLHVVDVQTGFGNGKHALF